MFVIEDEIHAEYQEGEYESFEKALAELKRRSAIPWDKEPNKCPCTSWRTCERRYWIIEYDEKANPYKEFQRKYILSISSEGVEWQKY